MLLSTLFFVLDSHGKLMDFSELKPKILLYLLYTNNFKTPWFCFTVVNCKNLPAFVTFECYLSFQKLFQPLTYFSFSVKWLIFSVNKCFISIPTYFKGVKVLNSEGIEDCVLFVNRYCLCCYAKWSESRSVMLRLICLSNPPWEMQLL